ncbi:MAG: membrane protein insertase YidC [Saprospiraceae bacterium]|nr:membrane protein insertase YidC [Saprospiraceae bacterium]
MDRNSLIGMILLVGLFFLWLQLNQPSQDQVAKQKQTQDSLARVTFVQDSLSKIKSTENKPASNPVSDSIAMAKKAQSMGAFANAAVGTEKSEVVENDLFKVTFTNKGARIKEVELKNYKKLTIIDGKEAMVPVKLLEDTKNKFEYLLPVANAESGFINSSNLYFTPSKTDNGISFKAEIGDGKYIEQTYTITKDNYSIQYNVNFVGLNNVIKGDVNTIELNWENYLDKLEKNADYERNYSSIYYKPNETKVDYCSCTKNANDNVDKPLKWVSNSNQFFNTSLIANNVFTGANLTTEMFDNSQEDLKKCKSQIRIPFNHSGNESFGMSMYVGPNEYDRLKAFDVSLQDQIAYGTSILGTINRWPIRPVFVFLLKIIGSPGMAILLLTLLVKLILMPLTYKMVYSQSKMSVLKPQIEKLKAKLGDDQQAVQMETMKLYREYGVNPLGGCLPMLLQMPIWLALYRFFPASIEFRQASFLWAPDLSTYDEWLKFGFNVPGFGHHVSLFALLWMITTLLYTWYNSKNMDFSSNPMMKYLQYIMPVTFIFFFNSFASGLSCYLCFSNILNIGQTMGTKYFLINEDKIKAELEKSKSEPKKKSGFASRLEEAMKHQQKVLEEKNKKK